MGNTCKSRKSRSDGHPSRPNGGREPNPPESPRANDEAMTEILLPVPLTRKENGGDEDDNHASSGNTKAPKRKKPKKTVTFFDFKGLIAPVFTCFKEDGSFLLETRNIDRYAQWLKSENIQGVAINGVTGEGLSLAVDERIENTEHWWKAANTHDLIMMVQIGGAPLPDVITLAKHAEKLRVDAVLCLPELFYKPRNVDNLVGYCKMIAKNCNTRPFFYYHIPRFTGVEFDMQEFCRKAEEQITNFYGIFYSSYDLEMGVRCLKVGRVVILGSSTLVASGMLLGFDSAMVSFISIRPDLAWDIYKAMLANDMKLARTKQLEVNQIIRHEMRYAMEEGFVAAMKNWFNKEMFSGNGKAGFLAGPARRYS